MLNLLATPYSTCYSKNYQSSRSCLDLLLVVLFIELTNADFSFLLGYAPQVYDLCLLLLLELNWFRNFSLVEVKWNCILYIWWFCGALYSLAMLVQLGYDFFGSQNSLIILVVDLSQHLIGLKVAWSVKVMDNHEITYF